MQAEQNYMHVRAPQMGYTLLELMVVLAIVAILAMLTIPGFQDTLSRNAREGAFLELRSALGLARSEAITRSRTVTICRSIDQATCAASTGSNWQDGWVIFVDAGVAGVVNVDDILVGIQGAGDVPINITLKTRLNGNFAGDFLQFDEDGFLGNSSTGAYFKFCSADNLAADARAMLLSNTGRPANSTDDGDGVHNDLEGDDLVCP